VPGLLFTTTRARAPERYATTTTTRIIRFDVTLVRSACVRRWRPTSSYYFGVREPTTFRAPFDDLPYVRRVERSTGFGTARHATNTRNVPPGYPIMNGPENQPSAGVSEKTKIRRPYRERLGRTSGFSRRGLSSYGITGTGAELKNARKSGKQTGKDDVVVVVVRIINNSSYSGVVWTRKRKRRRIPTACFFDIET